MIKNTATFNGQTFTRNSRTRSYSYVVIGLASLEQAVLEASRDHLEPIHAHNWEYLSSDRYTLDWRGNVDPALLVKRDQFRREYPTLEAYREAQHVKNAAALIERTGRREFNDYAAIGWSSRRDLAEKVASQNRGNTYWADVRIVEAETL